MAQWERVSKLQPVYRQQVDDLYDGDFLPMEVRHYLASWIETQDWEPASRDHNRAMVLFQVLLDELDIQHSRFVQEEAFLQQHNIRRLKHHFQRYQEQPCHLASVILWFLFKEKEILENAELAERVKLLQVQQNPIEIDNMTNVQRKVDSLKNKVECMEHTMICLEEQQDEFDFKYKTHAMEATTVEAARDEQWKVLQILLNRLDFSRKNMLAGLGELLDVAKDLLDVLVNNELQGWQCKQQRACIGAPDDISLEQLEKWFTVEATCLFQVRKFLKKLEELMGKMTYQSDPLIEQKPVLQKRVDELLSSLIKSAFVVETQPSMPQGKGPLVLRTNVQFSVKTRLLIKVPEMNHAVKVTVSMDKDPPLVKGYRRFNVLGTSSKALNMAESMNGGMVADFRHLTLKEKKSEGGGKGINDLSLSVTEELHIICFDAIFDLHGFSVPLETCSLPVVIISNSSQQQSAWASILWFNMLSPNLNNALFFADCPVAPWPKFRDMLSWQFLSATKKGLDSNQLDMIAQKLFGKQQSYEACQLSWAKFSKENVPNASFTFWVWFDGILVMVKNHLENLWKDGSIMGFVNKGKEKFLLKKKQRGTFLLRFSESIKDGGITFSWVDYSPAGQPDVRSVQPFTKVDLNQIPFHEIIRNFQIQIPGNVPESPLLYLYPNTPKDEAFGKYYCKMTGANSPYFHYIDTKLVFVSKENTLSLAWSDMTEGEGSRPENDMSVMAAGLKEDPLSHPKELLLCDPDPMLPRLTDEEENIPTMLEMFINDTVNFLPDELIYSDCSPPPLTYPTPQPCGSSYQ